ncbi:PREDICTED: uncharacterized protein LOC107352955 isoform X2 [Acropora digitifera]|uniref:uncharacterized protein LOC107352955 isoform X2 n=1 Tax=Acropora digitifera TaxID=70779 RepID=UPI00077A9AC2|nr:PREDICTED: uncharacterized protein LOC107352955 isoform X2 [Acropora digitifera]
MELKLEKNHAVFFNNNIFGSGTRANTSLAFPNVASQQERYRSVPEIRRITKAGSADGMRKSTRWALVASSLQSANPMFKTTSRRMQRQASFSEIAGKLMDATSETSRKLSRQIHRLTRAQEEQELQRLREKEEEAQNAKKRKKDNFASCLIQRKLSIFASYRRVSFPRDTLSQKEVRTVQMQYSEAPLIGL